jgi:hypothetical protein
MADLDAEERNQRLGDIVDTFSALELRAQILLAGFVQNPLMGMVLVADLNISAIVAKLKVSATMPELGSVGDDLKDWVARADAAAQRRNAIVHSLWALMDLTDPGSGARIKLSTRGKPSGLGDVIRTTAEPAGELRALQIELVELVLAVPAMTVALNQTGHWFGGTTGYDDKPGG